MYLPGVHRAPNIQTNPDAYEIENLATDPAGLIETAMREIGSWADKVTVDMGSGTGFYIPFFAQEASHVFAIEPHDASRLRAMTRVSELGLANVSVLTGSAEDCRLRDRSVDFYHSRFAYFWPPDCVPGILELDRIMRQYGVAVIIDNDYESGEFAGWLKRRKRAEPLSQSEKERFWASYGFQCRKVESEWRFQSRADFESVVRIEFAPELADEIIGSHQTLKVGYTFCLYHREF